MISCDLLLVVSGLLDGDPVHGFLEVACAPPEGRRERRVRGVDFLVLPRVGDHDTRAGRLGLERHALVGALHDRCAAGHDQGDDEASGDMSGSVHRVSLLDVGDGDADSYSSVRRGGWH
jgi:hypothetical protein